MQSRRDFFAGMGLAALLASIEEAAAIEAAPGSSYLDAEHVVILMQENRSFDHVYGTLRGVRGFADPRAVTLPDQNPVWMQKDEAGNHYAPFHLDITKTNATWLGSLPHSWRDQTDACSQGNHDQWLIAKKSGRKDCGGKPLTMGYYDRSDLPFYYALADAFTLCDQNFCSSLTGTTPNRLYLWTGTIRETQDARSEANVRNSDVTYNALAKWTTFPERLEDAGVSWKIYQNELSVPTGFSDDEDAWLANFTDNPIEWFEQYGVFHHKLFRDYAAKAVADPAKYGVKPRELKMMQDALAKYSGEPVERTRRLHEKAFTTNSADASYRTLATHEYDDHGVKRKMTAPKGDVLHQFRKDVQEGKLPQVSWVVPPERFSDHPGAPWYGAWMLSEVIRILTANPEVWKKTIFVLTYDENDGYFDHVPPFRAPDPSRPETGKTTGGIDAGVEYWPLERDRVRRSVAEARGSSIGLGFRVPLLIASPWSRGGRVCSQVFDHTSVLQLLENIVSHKTGKQIRETNISAWRRSVCGDLSAVFFAPSNQAPKLDFPERDVVLERIHKAQFQSLPAGYRKVTPETLKSAMPKQEPGTRPSVPLPYELHAGGGLDATGSSVSIWMKTGKAAGSPFRVYAPKGFGEKPGLRVRDYAVEPGKSLDDTWRLDGFAEGQYHLEICGPNGFLRELRGAASDPKLKADLQYLRNGDAEVVLTNMASSPIYVKVNQRTVQVAGGAVKRFPMKLAAAHHWYDITVAAGSFLRRFCGRIETGKMGVSDPQLGS